MWGHVRRHCLSSGKVAEVMVKLPETEHSGAGGGKMRMCFQLLKENAGPEERREENGLLDRHPAAQMFELIQRAGSVGMLSTELRDVVGMSGKHFQAASLVLTRMGIVRQREILGRGVAYRYFSRAGANDVSTFLQAPAPRRDDARGRGSSGIPKVQTKCEPLTVQQVTRAQWFKERLAEEKAVLELGMRTYFHARQKQITTVTQSFDAKTMRRPVA